MRGRTASAHSFPPKGNTDFPLQYATVPLLNLKKKTYDKRYWENKRAEIRKKEKQLDERLQRYTDDADTLRAHRREIIDEARAEAKKILESSNAAIERTIAEIKKANAERELTLEARRRLKEEREALEASGKGKENSLLARAPKNKKNKQPRNTAAAVTATSRPIEPGVNVRQIGRAHV